MEFDFGGYATKNNLRCSDGRTIRQGAFKENEGAKVPLVWQHFHDEPSNVLGHAVLENRNDGVYAYCTLNDSKRAKETKVLIEHGDINSLSIYANQLVQNGNDVLHGNIREVSVVLAGANPGAKIDNICLRHSDGTSDELDDEAIIYSEEDTLEMKHADNPAPTTVTTATAKTEPEPKKDNDSEDKTVGEVLDTLTPIQKKAVEAVVGAAIAQHSDEGEGDKMAKHNVFENDDPETTLSHADTAAIFADVKRYGSLRDATLAHGIEDIEWLFPEAKNLNTPPDWIKRPDGWVSRVLNAVHHTPFSRIKSMFADITEDEARARGYIKGKQKKDEVFTLLKRTTTPTTIYKKQKFDRDDLIDIVDFDAVSWIKSEMRMMLDEELARAVLIGDGRSGSSDDKIPEINIRPIWTDDDLFTIKVTVNVSSNTTADQKSKAVIRTIVKSRKDYRGSGSPILFTTEDVLTDILLMEDANGRIIYDSLDKVKNILRVSDIITVPVMEGATRTTDEGQKRDLIGLIVNLKDYNVGADKGGAVSMFDDFDIDYNAQKYLIETRCSGALIKPYSAIAIEAVTETVGG